MNEGPKQMQDACKMPKKCVDNQPPWLNDVLVAWLRSTFDATAIGQNFADLFLCRDYGLQGCK